MLPDKESILVRRFSKLEKHYELEHDYPDELAEALEDLRFCIDQFEEIEGYYHRAKAFAGRYTDALV